jgi:hypothetical protein
MQYRRAFGSRGDAPGQFAGPVGITIMRCWLVVTEASGERAQVLTPFGAPLQVVALDTGLGGLAANWHQEGVWVVDQEEHCLHELKICDD